jgi:hypothetical protein
MAKAEEKLTPAMKQFHHFKQKYPDAVLFFLTKPSMRMRGRFRACWDWC